jgi:hypothetical protein
MSFRLEMLQVARIAPKVLGDASNLVAHFLQTQRHPNGGFMDRDGKPDLYYTVFGLEGLMALRMDPNTSSLIPWLQSHQDGSGLDFVHLCCLARCWSSVGLQHLPTAQRHAILARIETYRSADGGYHQAPEKEHGTAYGALLGYSAHQDLQTQPPATDRLLQSLLALQTPDGAWSNERQLQIGMTPAVAAATALCRHLQHPIPTTTADWLLQRLHPDGGFCAIPGIPVPDLLSTAVALHALDAMQIPLDPIREPCLDFIDSLWNAEGGFHGNWTDDDLDCEYTYYGLLSLGHLGL